MVCIPKKVVFLPFWYAIQVTESKKEPLLSIFQITTVNIRTIVRYTRICSALMFQQIGLEMSLSPCELKAQARPQAQPRVQAQAG